MTAMQAGDRVRLRCQDNPRLDGAAAVVQAVTHYGAIVSCAAAATGQYRALHAEMVPAALWFTPSGDLCGRCGSPNMRRAGACLTCFECGESSGCG